MPAFLPFLGGLALKGLNAAFFAGLANDLSGGRIGNLLKGRGFKSSYQLQLQKYNQDQSRQQFSSGFNRRLTNLRGGSGESGARGLNILSFLGDRSRKLDDAPDIVEENTQVLDGVPTFGGLIPPSTVVPDIQNPRILEPSFEGVRLEIEKINRNIDAIKSSMLSSALVEAEYRKEMIEDMQQALAEKGKDRSQTRSERSIFNLITRPITDVQNKTGTIANELTKALLFSLGLEVAGAVNNLFGGDGDNKGGEDVTPPGSSGGIKAGDYVKIKTKRGSKYRVWDGEKFGTPTNVLPRGGDLIDVEPSAFTPMTMDDFTDGLTGGVEGGSDVNQEVSFKMGDTSITGGSDTNNIDFMSMFNSTDNVARRSVEPGSGTTNVIDLRTAQKIANIEDNGSASTQLNDEIADLDPSKGASLYEMYVRNS
tara:strand:+ start:1000 stop:2271 length:1272 start_codon:yes stop_codon:yes gene_type:complete